MDNNNVKGNAESLQTSANRFEGTYLQWLKEELTGWDRFPWWLFGLGVGFQAATLILNPINWISVLSFVGIFFGMFCTVAMGAGGYNKQGERVASHAINGLLGAISVVAYVIINLNAHHWWSVLDQMVFFFLIDLPLLVNWRTWGQGKNNVIKGLNVKQWVAVVITIFVAWGGLYYVGIILQDSTPLWDALALAIGAVASWLCFRRYSTTYTLWFISDIVNIVLWFVALREGYSQAALPMLFMTLFYFATCLVGLFNWRPSKN